MMPAATGSVERASNLVIMSRFANRTSFIALRRLWNPDDFAEEDRIKRILLKSARMSEDLRADMCRTRTAAWSTQKTFKELFAKYGLDTDLPEPAAYVYRLE